MQDNIVNHICVISNYLMDKIQPSFKLCDRPRYQLMEDNEFESCAAAFNNSSGTLCRSMASLRSAFQHCFAVFKKEVQVTC
jgi:hypothetical protein